MRKKILPLLACPICKGKLEHRSKSNELICHHHRLAFPIRNGIPILLESDARKMNETEKDSTPNK